MATDIEMAKRLGAAERGRSALDRYASALDSRKALTAKQVVNIGVNGAGQYQTELENAKREVELAVVAMTKAKCDTQSLAEVAAAADSAATEVENLRLKLAELEPTVANKPKEK